MLLRIILLRNKKKKKPFYKIIVINPEKKKIIIDKIGTYDPLSEPKKYLINLKKLKYWISIGATLKPKLASKVIELIKNK